MQDSSEIPGRSENEAVNHWAELEGKSPCMAEELAQRVESAGNGSSLLGRLLCGIAVVALIATLCVAIGAIAYFRAGSADSSQPPLPTSDVIHFRP